MKKIQHILPIYLEILTPQKALIKKYAKMFNLLRTIGGYKIIHHTWFIQCGFLVIIYLFLVESVVIILLVSYIMYMYIMSNCILVLP
jgi:hypothetical protein